MNNANQEEGLLSFMQHDAHRITELLRALPENGTGIVEGPLVELGKSRDEFMASYKAATDFLKSSVGGSQISHISVFRSNEVNCEDVFNPITKELPFAFHRVEIQPA